MPNTITTDLGRTAAAPSTGVPTEREHSRQASVAVPIIVLALFLSSATVVASDHSLVSQAGTAESLDHFRSQAAALSFLRVAAGAWAVGLSALQALVMKLLARGLAPQSRIRFSQSWLWVLAGQVPFMVAVFVTRVLGGPGSLDVFTSLGLRIGFGLVSVALYCFLAHRCARMPLPRAAILAAVMALLNSALLLLGR